MSSDDPQNSGQPGEFNDFLLDLDLGPDKPGPEKKDPPPASPEKPEVPPKTDESPPPADKADPAKAQEKEIKSLLDGLDVLRRERKNQEVVISELTEANTKLQEKFDSAEKQHKVQQENAVELATKAAVGQVTRERDTARTERDRARRSVKILAAGTFLALVAAIFFVAHDILETGPKSNTSAQQPSNQEKGKTNNDKIEAFKFPDSWNLEEVSKKEK